LTAAGRTGTETVEGRAHTNVGEGSQRGGNGGNIAYVEKTSVTSAERTPEKEGMKTEGNI